MRGQRVSEHPILSVQFDFNKNTGRACDFLMGESRRSIWWKCERGHSWISPAYVRIDNRNEGRVRPCPYCSGRKASSDNNLSITHGNLCKEWDYEKNEFGPESVTHKMAVKVWWKCRYGHEWMAQIFSRADHGAGCPKCICRQTSHIELRVYSELKSIFPDTERDIMIGGWRVDIVLPSYKIALEVDGSHWHKKKVANDIRKDAELTKHGYVVVRVREKSLSPTGCETIWYEDGDSHLDVCKKVVGHITKKVGKNIQYEGWKNEGMFFKILSQIGGQGRKAIEKVPRLLKEWHPTKNGRLMLEDLTVGTGVEVWWICSFGHEYRMSVKDRVRGRGCPYCVGKRVCVENSVASHSVSKQWAEDLNEKSTSEFTLKSNKKVWWRCEKGHVWNATIYNRTTGSGCPYCSGKRKNPETLEHNCEKHME